MSATGQRVGAVLAGLLAIALAVSGCGRGSKSEEATASTAPPVPVATVLAQVRQSAKSLNLTGTVKASLSADVAPKLMSKVAQVLVREGERVSAGQVLVRLESADLAAQVRQAEAGVTAAQAGLAQARTAARIQGTQSQTRVSQAASALRQAEEQGSIVREGARKQQKTQADLAVTQARAARDQAVEGVRQAQAGLSSAKAQLSMVQEGARRQQRLQADAGVRQAEAGFRTAQATYDRFDPLASDGVISRQRMDEITLQRDVARSQLDTAREQASLIQEGARGQEVLQAQDAVRTAESGVAAARQRVTQAEAALSAAQSQRDLTYEGSRGQEIRQAEAQVSQAQQALRMARASSAETAIKADASRMLAAQLSQAQAALQAARTQLSYATLTAPFSGVVTHRAADPGAMASPGVPLITLVDTSAFRLEAVVPESQAASIHLGDPAQVILDSLGQTLRGQVTQVVPTADPASRTQVVKIGIRPVPGLSPGLFGRASIRTGAEPRMMVPVSAVQREHGLTGVYVVRQGKLELRLVTLGQTEGTQVQVLSGLSSGETLVARGVDELHDGQAVSPEGARR